MFRVGSDRTWSGDLDLAAGKIHTLKARADDRSESDPYTVTVGEVSEGEVKITSLKDSKGEVASGGTTTDTQLTITGSAKDGEVKLLEGDNTTPIETFTAADGTWGGEIELTAGKTYVLKAEDVDGEKSETHTVTVSEASEGEVKITSLKDSEEGEIEDGDTTADTTLTITGSAKDGEVKLLDGDNPTPIKTFTAADGTWGGEIELTAGTTYVLKAEDVDGEKSETHTVTVSETSEGEVKITSLKDSEEGEIEDGDTTADTTLTITGSAKDGEVKLLDGDNPTPIKTFTAADGTWGGEIELTAGTTYVLKAEDVDGEKSETHTVIVSEAPPETRVRH
jgi:FtsP/CotA-like multicopper oxidase with cupredoxin domain